ncbi:hypothetical protein GCM10010358_19880 [Streptomyces minutiscleroticus]|uniref:DUF559 domain-containing protein n=1 Tax=Streptomyces minutiscleroticus TaxID=68238 RepID=A0A918NE02_9ACTN|nr:hypothetical protein [Streptomyces minutiscleroticus]GGX65533.1 hypothetical protein GCM10010358_19880 [Streptomyces minutiscleroticus]
MGGSHRSPDEPEVTSSKDELTDDGAIGAAAILLAQRGQTTAASLMLDVTAFVFQRRMHHEESMDFTSELEYEDVILEVEPYLASRFDQSMVNQISSALDAVGYKWKRYFGEVTVREVIPEVGPDWRNRLARELEGKGVSNQGRKVRYTPTHPRVDDLHLTNEWEHRVYQVLRERQASFPDNETIGIIPLAGMRVLEHTFEPDLIVTYRGRVGVIEVDGPHHKGRRSDDAGRERLLRNAGIRHIDRIDVVDSTQRSEVEKFVTDFLKHLGAH